jgi:hypothetical protein
MKKRKSFQAVRTMTDEDAAVFWQRKHHQVMRSKKAYDRRKEKRAAKLDAFGPFNFSKARPNRSYR